MFINLSHSPPSPFHLSAGGIESPNNFFKNGGELDRISIFRGGENFQTKNLVTLKIQDRINDEKFECLKNPIFRRGRVTKNQYIGVEGVGVG